MNYSPSYIDKENYYSVGVDSETGNHMLEVVITHIAWYSRYFALTEDEIRRFKSDPASLKPLALSLAGSGAIKVYASRLVYSEKTAENELRDSYLSNNSA